MIDRSFLIEQSYRSLEPEGMEKDAFLAPLAANIARLFGLGTRAAGAAGAAGVAGAAAKPSFLQHAGSLLGFGGREGTLGYKMGKPLSWIPGIGGREGAANAISFGGLGGVLGAAMPGEGESRLEAGLKGFGMGTLSGIGWEVGQRGFTKGLKRFMKPTSTFGRASELGWGDIWNRTTGSQMPKLLGAKALMGTGGLAAGIGGSAGIEHLYDKTFGKKSTDPYSFKGFGATPTSSSGISGYGGGTIPSGMQGGFNG